MQTSQSCLLTTSALLNDERYYVRGIAESDLVAIALSVDDFHKAIGHSPVFARFVIQGYARRVSSIIGFIDRMAARDVMLDVCQYLLANIVEEMIVSATQIVIANELGQRERSSLESFMLYN